MKKNLIISVLMTIVTTVLLGLVYPLLVTALAQVFFRDKANGQLVQRNGTVVASRIIAQPFVGAGYFHPRPSAAGSGYDAASSGGSNLGPLSRKLEESVAKIAAAYRKENGLTPESPVPADAVTGSGSGLDPHISPANAALQAPRVAVPRGVPLEEVSRLAAVHREPRQWLFLGEPRVNVLALNLA